MNTNNSISKEEYHKILSNIDNIITSEELMEIHKRLIDDTESNYAFDFIEELLTRDWGRSIAYQYQYGAYEFIQSEYLSTYLKKAIKEMIPEEYLGNKAISSLNSDELISSMGHEEISDIYFSVEKYNRRADKPRYDLERTIISYLFKNTNITNINITNINITNINYPYKQNCQGVKEFFKNDLPSTDLAEEILIRSGLNPRASYYSGCGVNYDDVNQDKLALIFGTLFDIEPNYALEFGRMVIKMKTLGATEFITTFKELVSNGFKSDSINPSDNNISFEGAYGETRDAVALASVFSIFGAGKSIDEQIAISEHIKLTFIGKIGYFLHFLDSNLAEEYYASRNWNYDIGSHHNNRQITPDVIEKIVNDPRNQAWHDAHAEIVNAIKNMEIPESFDDEEKSKGTKKI